MNKRIVWSLAAAAIFAAGPAMAAGQGMGSGMMGSGMMGGHGHGMMYAAASGTRAGPDARTAQPGYYGMGRYGGSGRYGMGPGMMGGYGGYGMGHGMMGGYGGYGMGPGMMGGYGGYGGYGMGHGMMGGYGGYGMGHGMMGGYGGYGMGPGMMYGYGGRALGLTAQQRDKIADIWNRAMQKSWPLMGQLREQHFQLARLLERDNPDRAAVDKAYRQMSDLRRKLLDQRLQAREQVLQVLTAEQRKQLRQGFYDSGQ